MLIWPLLSLLAILHTGQCVPDEVVEEKASLPIYYCRTQARLWARSAICAEADMHHPLIFCVPRL